jgi:hypothetical protein
VQAEAVELKLQQEQAEKLALQKEVMQLKLVKEEAEAAAKQLREQLTDAEKALTRETAEHQATSAVLSDLRANLESREQQLGDARQLLDSMSAELGILSSRLHRLQQERDSLRTVSARQQERLRRQLQEQQQAQPQAQSPAQLVQLLAQSPRPQRQLTPCQLDALQPLSGAAAAAAQLQMTGQASSSNAAAAALGAAASDPYATDGSTVDSQSFVDCLPDALQPPAQQPPAQQRPQAPLQQQQVVQVLPVVNLPRFNSIPTGSASRGSSPAGCDSDICLLAGIPDPATDQPVPLCPHGQLDGACLLCMCQRFLEATAGSCSHWVPGSSLSAAAARLSNSGSCLPNPAAAAAPAGEAGPSTSGSSRGILPAGSAGATAAGLATAAVAACATEAAEYRQYLSISELARNRLEAEHATLQQQVQDLQRQVQQQQHELQVLQAHPAALTACSIEELMALEGEQDMGWNQGVTEAPAGLVFVKGGAVPSFASKGSMHCRRLGHALKFHCCSLADDGHSLLLSLVSLPFFLLVATLEGSTKAVRQVVLQRSIVEYQRQASAETLRCAVCMEAKRSLAFGCGHQTCDNCGDKMSVCPFCRQDITAKIRLFE